MGGTLAELYSAREQVTRKKRADYEWNRKTPWTGKKVFTPKGVGNVTAVSKCGERVLVFVTRLMREMMFPTNKVRDKAKIKSRKEPDAVSLAINGLDLNMLRLVCFENGINYDKISHLNEGMQKMAVGNAIRRRIKNHGSAFVVDRIIKSLDVDGR